MRCKSGSLGVSRSEPGCLVQRAKIILFVLDGDTNTPLVGVAWQQVGLWRTAGHFRRDTS